VLNAEGNRMPYVLPNTRYPCLGTAEAEAFAAHLTTDGRIVTVPGMDLRAAMDIAELGVTLGFMSDMSGVGVIAAIEANPDKRYVDGPPAGAL
jgi:hypothetical protein